MPLMKCVSSKTKIQVDYTLLSSKPLLTSSLQAFESSWMAFSELLWRTSGQEIQMTAHRKCQGNQQRGNIPWQCGHLRQKLGIHPMWRLNYQHWCSPFLSYQGTDDILIIIKPPLIMVLQMILSMFWSLQMVQIKPTYLVRTVIRCLCFLPFTRIPWSVTRW